MLASLLPGLRDVRTPLTVGYLWLVTGWLTWADKVPRTRPASDGLVSRVFELAEILGAAYAIAAVSFTAYVLGALLTLPVESSSIALRLAERFFSSPDARATIREFENALRHKIGAELGDASLLMMGPAYAGPAVGDLTIAEVLQPDPTRGVPQFRLAYGQAVAKHLKENRRDIGQVTDLRPRLLVANPELYGEYDRLASEAAFRLNLGAPLIALGIVAGVESSLWWTGIAIATALLLAAQGLSRLGLATAVIRRAVIAEVIDHPLVVQAREIARGEPSPGWGQPAVLEPPSAGTAGPSPARWGPARRRARYRRQERVRRSASEGQPPGQREQHP
jgi:hypothetical protein